MLHTRLNFPPATTEKIFADLHPLFAFYYPLASPYLRVSLSADSAVRLSYDLTEPGEADLVLWGSVEEEQAVVLKRLEAELSPDEAVKRARARKRGYYEGELLACKRPLIAVRISDLRHCAPRARSVDEVSRVLHSEARGYWLSNWDGSETVWGLPEPLPYLIPGHGPLR